MDPRKTRPCKFFFDPNRTCQKGESCDFSHDPDAQNSQQERSNGPPRFGGSNNSRGGFGSGRGGFTGGSGSSRGGFTGGGGHLHQSSGGGGGGHQGNYHNKDNNEKYGGPTSSNNRGRPWRSRPDFPQKPHNNESREFPQKTNSGGSCKYFRQGTCNSGDKCKFKHTWTENDDLALVYSNSFGEDNVKTDDYEIRDVCVIDISKKFVAFANPKTIFFVDLGNAGISGNDFQTKNMGPTEELTCMRYFENAFIVGVYDNQKKCSLVKIISLDGNEFSIDPAHQDYILDICNIKDLIVTASLDEKIKFWRWNAINMKFEIAYTHPHKEMSKIKNLTYNGIDSLFVANSDFSLSVFTLDYTTPTLTLKLIGNYENYHSNIITTLKFFMLNQQTHLITSSFDSTIKFFSLEQGKAIHQQQFEEPIASLDIVSNSKDKDILAIGYANGGVGLYDMSMNFQEVGTLILHKQRIISNVYGFSERKNDVSFNYMITSDTGGRVSVWQFQKGK